MRTWVMVLLAACGSPAPTKTTTPAPSGPSCAEVGVHAAPLFRADDATNDQLAANIAGHCEIDQWAVAARTCVMGARDHDGLHGCAHEHLTGEQSDKLAASITPLVQREDPPTSEVPPTSTGGTQAEIAAGSAEEAEKLYKKERYAEASAKYMDAVARVPEPTYFYGLCKSRYREGKLAEALTACNAAERNGPPAPLVVKIREMQTTIKNDAQKQGIKL